MPVLRITVMRLWDGLLLCCRNIGIALAGLCYLSLFYHMRIAMSLLRHAMQHTSTAATAFISPSILNVRPIHSSP